MRILVTGGTGFVGLHIVRRLIRAGHSVVSLGPDGTAPPAALEFLDGAGGVAWVRGDILDGGGLHRILREHGVDAIVHAAAVTAIGSSEAMWARRAAEVNVAGTVSVMEAAHRGGVGRVVHVSSATIYGSGDPDIPIGEEAARAARQEDIYAISKWAGERACLRCAELFGLSANVVRLSAPYGPMELPSDSRSLMSPVWTWCRAALAGEPVIVGGDLKRDFTYAQDSAAGIVLALTSTMSGREFNIACGVNHRFSDVLASIKSLVPGFTYRIEQDEGSAGFLERSQRGALDIGRAERELGFAPRYTLRRGLEEYLTWLGRRDY